jgi:outer membrane receptor protein involved in Fe transport
VTDTDTKKPYGLVNVDWNITDRHLLEYTFIQDKREYEEADFSTDSDANGYATKADYTGTDFRQEGGTIHSIKYSGSITDNLTLTAQYGTLESKRSEYLIAPDGSRISYNGTVGDFNQPGCPIVTYNSTWTNYVGHDGEAKPSCYIVQTIATDSGVDKRKGGRADITYKLPMSLAGMHTFGVGYEFDRWTSFFGESYSGGTAYRYQRGTSTLNTVSHDQVRVRHFQTGADVGVDTDAFYIKDDWQLTDNLLLQLGVRSDSFKNLNGDGVPYAQQDNIIQPRISAAWDISGDSSKKLYGSYGIYSLPIAATVAVRGASASIFSNQNFTYATINPTTGAPTGLVADGSLGYLNHEDGRTLDPDTVASSTLDPTIQEEFVVGYQMELGKEWKAGIRGTYRNLKKTTDDICDLRPFKAWSDTHLGVGNFDDTNLPGCLMINPGYAIDANVDVDGNGTKEMVHLTPEDVGLPKAIRKYYAVELSLEKLWNQSWYTQMSYTWAHNYGNAEGLVKSDIGQDDTGVTQDFDFKEIMVNSYGNLPNDRRHAFKLLAAYKPAESLTLSTNMVVQTGRPRNCYGVDEQGDTGQGYGASYFTCNDKPVPRGTAGVTDTLFNIDVSAAYAPEFAPGLSLKVSVFNLFNNDATTYYQEEGEVSVGDEDTPLGVPDVGYGSQRNFQRPRYVQFTLAYAFGGKR